MLKSEAFCGQLSRSREGARIEIIFTGAQIVLARRRSREGARIEIIRKRVISI